MYCNQCGTQLPDGAKFCQNCGMAAQNESASQPVPVEQKKEANPIKEKKPMAPPKKKTLVKILGLIVLLAAVIGGICLYLQNHDVADIPDPEYYFGDLGEVEVEDYGSAVSYLIWSETDLADATQAYYELVTSAYPFELDEEHIDDDGDITYELRYNGDGYIWKRSIYRDIDIDYFGNDYSSSDNRYVSGVWISRPKNFNITPMEQYDGSKGAAGGDELTIMYIPELEHYFGAQNQSDRENEESFTFDSDPRDAVKHYVELLRSKYDIVLDAVYEDDGAGEWVMHHKDSSDASITIWTDRAGDGTWEVICRMTPFTIQNKGEVWEWPQAVEQKPENQPVSRPGSSDPSVIPNFLDYDASGKYEMTDDSREGKGVYRALDLGADYVAQDYVDRLVNMGYSIVYTEEDVHSGKLGGIFKQWDFRHDGVNASALRNESTGQIRVKLNTYETWDKCTVSVEFADGITMQNYNVSGGSGGSNSSTSSYNKDLYDAKPICGVCNGDGDCNTCSGDGYLQSSASGKEDRNCYSCSGSGNCRSCGGDGRL